MHAMEDSVATTMATFRQQLKQFRSDLARREDEWMVLVEDFVTRVDEVEDLKMRVTILEKVVAHGVETQNKHTSKIHVPEFSNALRACAMRRKLIISYGT